MNKQQITQEEFDKKVESILLEPILRLSTMNIVEMKEYIKSNLKERYEIKNQEVNNEM